MSPWHAAIYLISLTHASFAAVLWYCAFSLARDITPAMFWLTGNFFLDLQHWDRQDNLMSQLMLMMSMSVLTLLASKTVARLQMTKQC